MKVRRRAAVAALIALAVTLGNGAGVAVARDAVDPAATAATAATERWAREYGIYREASSVQTHVYRSDAGPVTVTYTKEVTPLSDTASIDTQAGHGEVSGSFQVTAATNVAAFASAGTSWVNYGNACQSREQNATGFIDGCYQIYKESADNDSAYDYYTWKQWATAKSTGIYALNAAWGKSWRNSTSTGAWYWVDWSPRADLDMGNCASYSLGVSYIAEASATYTVCDKWDMLKSSTAGTFQNYWRGYAYRSEREVAHMTLIKTPAGRKPVWSFDHGFSW